MMKSRVRRICASFLSTLLILAAGSLTAQESPEPAAGDETPQFGFGVNLGLGVRTFRNPAFPDDPDASEFITWQSLQLNPDISFGQLGVGLDLTLNYTFTGGEFGDEFTLRAEDWVPDDDTNFFELYLPKIRYVRWAQKGDPLFLLFGQIDGAVLGNAFIVGGYTNTRFLPERPIFGAQVDVDGSLFSFPYLGVETFVSNVAAFDLFGSRLYVRPLADLDVPLLPALEVGTTVVTDRDPWYFERRDPDSSLHESTEATSPVTIWGLDLRQPVLNTPVLSLALFSDVVNQNNNWGSMVGFGGRTLGFLSFGAQARFLGENFIPSYFDGSYDLFRRSRYEVYRGNATVESYVGWLASLGFSFLQDQLVFSASMEGPFEAPITDVDGDGRPTPQALARNPILRGSFLIGDGVIPGITVGANYEKRNLQTIGDVISPEDAVIGARINYRTGPAVISLTYDLTYDPNPAADRSPWQINSGLETSIALF
ncbi:MAG: hypothetical protein EA383_11830 [Spirochaetaceae bacterium]|nr:MAG: hypothetical protein EA383_11830 [Spirochaetaceae bacterium]